MSRRRARKEAFLILYQNDVTGNPVQGVVQNWREYRGDPDEHALQLVQGVDRVRGQLDRMLEEVAVGWSVYRMSAIDRTVLRLALYEMLYMEDVPVDVAIGEALELVKGFSSDESPAFVSGVLRGIASRMVAHG